MLSAYDGQILLGYLLAHRFNGVEAFTPDYVSLGMFVDQRSVADALTKRAAS
jgi:hypothetical protein